MPRRTTAAAVLGNAPLSAEESVKARRVATTAKGLEVVSEQQRNGGGKHARAALRTIAGQHLTPKATYAGETPAFAQAKTVQYHRDVISGASPVTPGFRTVVENFSDSSDDESVAALSPVDAIHRYRLFTETKAVRERLAADAGGGKETAKPSAASSLPVHGPRTAGEDSHQTPARPSRKHAAP